MDRPGSRRKRLVRPTYPNRCEMEGNLEEFLGRFTRNSRRLAAMGLAGGLLIIGLAGCEAAEQEDPAAKFEDAIGEDKDVPPFAGSATVAPIFAHGNGRAALGCVVVAPPAFLTEEEARSIIGEELRKAGVVFTEHDVKLDGVKIQEARSAMPFADEKVPEAKALVADLVDPKKRIAVEFVSEKDYHDLGGLRSASTVQAYNFHTVATRVAEQISRQNKDRVFGVFYEPVASMPGVEIKWPANYDKLSREKQEAWLRTYRAKLEEMRQQAVAKSKEELRAQVHDFAVWLRQRGVI